MKVILSILLVFLASMSISKSASVPKYTIPSTPWPESFGNHRAVIEVTKATEVALLDILWRRHDPDPRKRRFIIIEASSGDTVHNIYRFSVSNERCRLAFGPVKKPGTYKGSLTFKPESISAQSVDLEIKVMETILTDRGDSETWRHSRLRWLNSTLGIDDNPTARTPCQRLQSSMVSPLH